MFFCKTSYISTSNIMSGLLQGKMTITTTVSTDSQEDVPSLSDRLSSIKSDDSATNLQYIIKMLQQTRCFMSFKGQEDQQNIVIPREWTICTLVRFQLPGQPNQLIISKQRPGTKPIVVKVPMSDTVPEDDIFCKDGKVNDSSHPVLDLSQLLQGSIEQEFSDIMESSLQSMKVAHEGDWMQTRIKLDSRLKILVERMEDSWLGIWKGIVLGQHTDAKYQKILLKQTKELADQLYQNTKKDLDEDLLQMILDSHDHLTKFETRTALSVVTGISQEESLILDKAVDDFQLAATYLPLQNKGKKKEQRHPVILLLSKDIQNLPWENIPILRQYPVTRMPSKHFLLAEIMKGEHPIDPVKTYFVLDPSGNLPNTKEFFHDWFESILNWNGVCGEKPSKDQYKFGLSDHDLFLYLGHNAGQSLFGGEEVQRTVCKAAVFLMGCSTAKLIVDGTCEPRGITLNYILAGSPAVVGNLWNVTDRDIDIFTKFLLKEWLNSGQKWSLPHFLRDARQSCRLSYLNGAAPVVYGVPVYLKDSY